MTVYLNGRFLPLEDAKISVLDRGFIYGDGVYELIPVYHRRPFRLRQHLARLQRSLDGIRLVNPHGDAEWESIIRELVARTPFDDQGLYFQVTRGVAKRDHSFPPGVAPTVFILGPVAARRRHAPGRTLVAPALSIVLAATILLVASLTRGPTEARAVSWTFTESGAPEPDATGRLYFEDMTVGSRWVWIEL